MSFHQNAFRVAIGDDEFAPGMDRCTGPSGRRRGQVGQHPVVVADRCSDQGGGGRFRRLPQVRRIRPPEALFCGTRLPPIRKVETETIVI